MSHKYLPQTSRRRLQDGSIWGRLEKHTKRTQHSCWKSGCSAWWRWWCSRCWRGWRLRTGWRGSCFLSTAFLCKFIISKINTFLYDKLEIEEDGDGHYESPQADGLPSEVNVWESIGRGLIILGQSDDGQKNHESVRKMAELTIKHYNHALCLAQFVPSWVILYSAHTVPHPVKL